LIEHSKKESLASQKAKLNINKHQNQFDVKMYQKMEQEKDQIKDIIKKTIKIK